MANNRNIYILDTKKTRALNIRKLLYDYSNEKKRRKMRKKLMPDKPKKLKIIYDDPYEYFYDDRKNPIQAPIELAERKNAVKITLEIPGEWHNDIYKMAKRLKIHPEFLYRKAFQAFFGFSPAVWDDDGYLEVWRHVFELDGEQALRDNLQDADDVLTRKVVRFVKKNKKVF